MHLLESDLKKIVLDSGLVNEGGFQSAKDEAFRSGRKIIDVLVGRGDVSDDYITDLLSKFFRAPTVDLRQMDLKGEIVELLPESFAKSRGVVVFDYDKDKRVVKVALQDVGDLATLEYIRHKFNADVEYYITSFTSLKYGLKQHKKKVGDDFNQTIKDNIQKSLSDLNETNVVKMAEEIPIISILDSVVEHAVVMGASDIHFEPMTDKFLVRYRIDGIMQDILSLPVEISSVLVARIKILANLQIDVHGAPQDGRFRFDMEDQKIDVRVSIMPTFHGEKVETRLLRGSLRPLNLTELGLSAKDLKIVEDNIEKTHGLILITGPTGHGKTTTLYAILHLLNTPKVNIATVEDPVEYDVPRINQTQINVKAGVTFASGLRALVRQNPDIIMIGEIRDSETIDIAVNAALTGHLVLSTLHTNDAPTAIPRMLDMGAPAFLLASTVNIIAAQRLVRKICPVCVASYKPSEEIKKIIKDQVKQIEAMAGGRKYTIPSIIFKGKGCKLCNYTGYKGQVAIFEILQVTGAIKKLITERAPADMFKKTALEEGMTTMFEDGLQKVEAGITTIEEVLRVVRE